MGIKKILSIAIFVLFFLSILMLAKPVFAGLPPPASHIWLFRRQPPQPQQGKVKVIVTWEELGQPQTVEMDTWLRDVRVQ